MKKNIRTRFLSMLLAVMMVVTILPCTASASVSWPATSGIKTYCLSTSNNTIVYKTKTSTAKYGTIYTSDLVTIRGYDSSSDRFYVSYTVTSSGGTKYGYVKRTSITSGKVNAATGSFTATAKITTYRRASTSKSLGYVSKGDKCYIVATSGDFTQIIYPLSSNGYKLGWVKTSSISGTDSPSSTLPTDIYLKQAGSTTCTLAAATMMLRARKYLSGVSYSSITESAVRSTAWVSNQGLRHSFTYSGITVSHTSVSGITTSKLKSILDSHPEGIVLYCGKIPHAVFVTRYSGNTFYCADPLSNYSGTERTLANSYLGKKYGSQAKILSNVTAYWYVSSY